MKDSRGRKKAPKTQRQKTRWLTAAELAPILGVKVRTALWWLRRRPHRRVKRAAVTPIGVVMIAVSQVSSRALNPRVDEQAIADEIRRDVRWRAGLAVRNARRGRWDRRLAGEARAATARQGRSGEDRSTSYGIA